MKIIAQPAPDFHDSASGTSPPIPRFELPSIGALPWAAAQTSSPGAAESVAREPVYESYPEGCELNPSCLNCPLPVCKEDDAPTARAHAVQRFLDEGRSLQDALAQARIHLAAVRRIFQPQLREQALDMFRAGVPRKQIAAMLGIGERQFYRWVGGESAVKTHSIGHGWRVCNRCGYTESECFVYRHVADCWPSQQEEHGEEEK